MLTLYHSPKSRSSIILVLLDEMGIADKVGIRRVAIPRMDGSGARDPLNPHPECYGNLGMTFLVMPD